MLTYDADKGSAIDLTQNAARSAPKTGIVALGGHFRRAAYALELAHQNPEMPVLFVGKQEVEKVQLGIQGLSGDQSRAVINTNAKNTEDEGALISAWAKAEGLDRLIVVTNDFHKRRSALELKRAFAKSQLYVGTVEFDTVPACVKDQWKEMIFEPMKLVLRAARFPSLPFIPGC